MLVVLSPTRSSTATTASPTPSQVNQALTNLL